LRSPCLYLSSIFSAGIQAVYQTSPLIDKYKPLLGNVDDALGKLDIDHGERLQTLERLLRLAENIGDTYKKALPPLKREYLTLFFSKIYIKDKKIVKYDLSLEVKEMIEAGSVRVRTGGLPGLDYVRTCVLSTKPILLNKITYQT
jgi:hypothetical protein